MLSVVSYVYRGNLLSPVMLTAVIYSHLNVNNGNLLSAISHVDKGNELAISDVYRGNLLSLSLSLTCNDNKGD